MGEPSSNTWPDPQHVGIPPFPMESRSHWLKPIGENTQPIAAIWRASTSSHDKSSIGSWILNNSEYSHDYVGRHMEYQGRCFSQKDIEEAVSLAKIETEKLTREKLAKEYAPDVANSWRYQLIRENKAVDGLHITYIDLSKSGKVSGNILTGAKADKVIDQAITGGSLHSIPNDNSPAKSKL